MAFNLSPGMAKALCGDPQQVDVYVNVDTISFGDGDGTVISGADTINDSGAGFGSIGKHDWLTIVGGGANHNKLVKVLSATASKLEVMAGSFSAVGAGSNVCIQKLKSIGTLRSIFKNSKLVIRTDSRPASADLVETGTVLLSITKDGNGFSAGVSENGLNIEPSSADETQLVMATDPETGVEEVWQATGEANGTSGWGRWYSNDNVTGATEDGVHMDGQVNTSGSDINMANGMAVTTGAISNVTSVDLSVEGV